MERLADYADFLTRGDFSDIFLEETESLALRWEEGRIETISNIEEAGAGLRIMKGLETRFAHANLPKPLSGLSNGAERDDFRRLSLELGHGLSAGPSAPLSAPRRIKTHRIKKPPAEISLDKKMALLEQAHKAAMAVGLLRQVSVNYGERRKRIGYLNSSGESFIEERVYLVFSVTATTEKNGDVQNAYDSIGGLVGFEIFDGKIVEKLASEIAQRALKKLKAPPAPIGEMPVIIAASAGGTLIHEAVGHSLEADAVIEGTSPAYRGKMGQRVAGEGLTVIDDPTLPFKRGSFYFDDEGVPAHATKLIENGILRDLLYDRHSAGREGRTSNGHGRRESYAHRPIPRMSNTFIAPGKEDPAAVLASVKNGFLVTKMGGGQVNTATGDFVFEVEEGFSLKSGKKTLIRGATLLGNGPETLRQIDRIGSDFGEGIGTCGKEGQGVPVSDGIPTIRIKKLVVGGRS